jgi:hypothetical protein
MDVRVVHLMGWSLVRGHDADIAEVDALARAELAAGASIAVELHSDPVETEPVEHVLLALQAAAAGAGARLAVVEADALARERFVSAGLVDVHESLDDATGSDAPVLRRAQDGAPPPSLAPASGDAITMPVTDLERR